MLYNQTKGVSSSCGMKMKRHFGSQFYENHCHRGNEGRLLLRRQSCCNPQTLESSRLDFLFLAPEDASPSTFLQGLCEVSIYIFGGEKNRNIKKKKTLFEKFIHIYMDTFHALSASASIDFKWGDVIRC